MTKTFGVVAIKGGVGKTSVVENLGAALSSEFNKKVLIVDANFSTPHLGVHLGLVNPRASIQDVLNDNASIYQALYEHYAGFHLIPGSMNYQGKVNPLKLAGKIAELKSHYDIVLIDSSPSLNDELLATMNASDELIVVTSPDYPTLTSTLHAVKLAEQRNTPIRGLVINRVRKKSFELTSEDIEKSTGVNVLGVLPDDDKVLEALSVATPATLYSPTGKAAIAYKKLAASLIGKEYEDPRFLSRMIRYLKEFDYKLGIKKRKDG